jgi:hypothetical protein
MREERQTHRQQGDFISLLTKIRGMQRETDTDGYIYRQHDDLISLLSFFKIR